MSARDAILAQVRQNQPPGNHPLPRLPRFAGDETDDLRARFLSSLEAMGGRQYPKGIQTVLQDLFPDAMAIASTAPEILGAHPVAVNHPRDLADVDVAVVRAAFGVAETGSVLLVDQALATHALVYLAQHLIVLLDPAEIVPTLQEAYDRAELRQHRYASFHTGPSATADIEGVLIHGAQGVRSLTVVLT